MGNFYDNFYVFDGVTSFLHQDKQVSQQFYDLNKLRNFNRVDRQWWQYALCFS